MPGPTLLPRNDLRQYDDLAAEWERPDGAFAALHWLAEARAGLVPAPTPGALLVDAACGGGVMAGRVPGYRHVGVDLVTSALEAARARGITVVQADLTALPLASESADVVVAGEVLEHVADLEATVAELARILKPGGTVVLDTINDTWWARFSLVTVGERLPGGPPPRIHDPALFVDPERLTVLFADHGVDLRTSGLRQSFRDYARFIVTRRGTVRMLPVRSKAALYQGIGTKRPPPEQA